MLGLLGTLVLEAADQESHAHNDHDDSQGHRHANLHRLALGVLQPFAALLFLLNGRVLPVGVLLAQCVDGVSMAVKGWRCWPHEELLPQQYRACMVRQTCSNATSSTVNTFCMATEDHARGKQQPGALAM